MIADVLKRTLIAVAFIAPQVSLAATLPEGTVSAYTPRSGGYHDANCPGCFVTAQLELSTTDRWNTAQISYAATVGGGLTTQINFVMLRPAVGSGFTMQEITAGPSLVALGGGLSIPVQTDGQIIDLFFTGGRTLSAQRPAWDVLSAGVSIDQSYFGNEFSVASLITFNDRRISSYSFDLFGPTATPARLTRSFATGLDSPAPVPLPASLAGLVFGLFALGGVRRRRA